MRRRGRSRTPEPVDPGDWVCRECHINNFRRKEFCFGCKKAKAEVTSAPRMRRGDRVMESKDWACKECDMVNFARRTECFKCSKPRSEVEKEAGEFRLGDWKCKECLVTNFSRRAACFKCEKSRKDCEVGYDSRGHVIAVGDWTCLECKENNFAKRVQCFKCKKPRTDEAGGSNDVVNKSEPNGVESADVISSDVVENNDVVKMEAEMNSDVVNLNFGETECGDGTVLNEISDDVMMPPE